MRALRHPNIVQLFDVVEEGPSGNKLYLIMELCAGGDLADADVVLGQCDSDHSVDPGALKVRTMPMVAAAISTATSPASSRSPRVNVFSG